MKRVLNGTESLNKRHLFFSVFSVGSLCLFWTPLRELIRFSLMHDYGSHIVLIAPASAYVIYVNRHKVLANVHSSLLAGLGLFVSGIILWWIARSHLSVSPNYFSLEILSMLVVWISGFILCYGLSAVRSGSFPLMFLLLIIPPPAYLITRIIGALQAGSAAVAYVLFRALNVPVFKDGFVLVLPTINIEVAEQCSGIRSSLALLITTLLLGKFVLRSGWSRVVLVGSALPILILKNGLRIVTVSLLSIYVDRAFLHGWIHTSGGVLFYALGVTALIPVMIALKKWELRGATNRARIHSVSQVPARTLGVGQEGS